MKSCDECRYNDTNKCLRSTCLRLSGGKVIRYHWQPRSHIFRSLDRALEKYKRKYEIELSRSRRR